MPGIVGGSVDSDSLAAMAESMRRESWYEVETVVGGEFGLASVNHGDRVPTGHTVWRGDGRAGVLHGVVSNRDELGTTVGEIFRGVLDRPDEVLPALDGPFLLACADRDGSIVVATDKLATRPCYYTTAGGFAFGSELKALVTGESEVDERAVSDMLLLGFVVGEKTLVSDVASLPPATYLQYEDGSVTTRRYWSPSFGGTPPDDYVSRTVDKYRRALSRAVDTVDGDVGLWLSSGLDSRTMAEVLDEQVDTLRAFTYGAYWGEDCPGARKVADALDLPHTVSDYTADDCLHSIEKAVDVLDGMHQWSFAVNLPAAIHDVPEEVTVLFEASGQGEFFGDTMNRYWLRNKSPTDALLALKRQQSPSAVRDLLATDVDPKQSLRRLVEQSPQRESEYETLDALWTVNAGYHFRSNKLYRSQTGTRVPFANGEFLDHVARMPIDEYRQRAFPFTDGRLPYGVSRLKLEVMRRVGSETGDIPYGRTGLPPKYPLALQAAGCAVTQLRKHVVDSRGTMQGHWYRHHDEMREFLDDLLDSAADRPEFDADAIRDVQQAHLDGETDNITVISAITTIELWRRKYLDRQVSSAAVPSSTLD